MTGSLRRRVAGILALAVGFGVIILSAPASAAPVDQSDFTTAAPVNTDSGLGVRADDWWW